jgi:hypothetical protein
LVLVGLLEQADQVQFFHLSQLLVVVVVVMLWLVLELAVAQAVAVQEQLVHPLLVDLELLVKVIMVV